MTKIWAIGQQYNWLVSNTAVASSIDGQIWQSIESPFDISDRGTCITANNNNDLVAASAAGNISFSSDKQTWQKGTIGVENFYVAGTVCTDKMIAVGRRYYTVEQDNYPVGSEIAQIFNSLTGEPDTWAMIFSSPYNPSGLNNIKFFPNAQIDTNTLSDVVVIVGDKFGTPFLCYSTDLGLTFTEIFIPATFNYPFWDVEYDESNHLWYFATNGKIAVANSLLNPQWTNSSTLDYNSPTIKLKLNPTGQMCAITKDSIWYSANLESWQQFSAAGYQWRSIEWFDNKWIAGAESTLTQYTFFTSVDGINWIPDNNGIQMMNFTKTS
jgi:hypothetical protein